ncbi:MAG TPA: FAD-binding protein, partial [Kofleriaceae bacterium]|nr:FAD-binding protein [Kofleriaceae bacterium]
MSSGDRALSFWGWGHADKFPDRATRKGLAGFASGLLGGVALEVREPPRLEDLALPAARIAAPSALAALASSTPHDRASHTYGKSYRDLARGFAGDFAVAPDLVLRPTTEADVAATLDWAAAAGVAVIPFGGGTSVVGGVEGAVGDRYRGVASLDLRGLDRVLEIDPVSRAARIQAGATGPGLEAQLGEHGLTLRHFPQSFEFST